jgi:hypothetical protein
MKRMTLESVIHSLEIWNTTYSCPRDGKGGLHPLERMMEYAG